MAEPQSNARPCADAGAPTSGVIHIRTRLTADFTVIANDLAQRRGSAVTIGVAAYIASLPDGTPVTIAALCQHFTEGEILISRALRELEAAGYLERRRERGPGGAIRTRTYFYDVPGQGAPTPPPPPPNPPRPKRAKDAPRPEPEAAPDATSLADADEQAVTILASLRLADPRLTQLPDRLRARPARILAFRLSEPPLPVHAPAAPPRTPPPVPWRTCDGCERAFRPAGPGRLCRDCRTGDDLRAAC